MHSSFVPKHSLITRKPPHTKTGSREWSCLVFLKNVWHTPPPHPLPGSTPLQTHSQLVASVSNSSEIWTVHSKLVLCARPSVSSLAHEFVFEQLPSVIWLLIISLCYLVSFSIFCKCLRKYIFRNLYSKGFRPETSFLTSFHQTVRQFIEKKKIEASRTQMWKSFSNTHNEGPVTQVLLHPKLFSPLCGLIYLP